MEATQETMDSRKLDVTAYVRPTLLLEPIDSKLQTLHMLDAEDVLGSFEVEAWPGQVPLAGEDHRGSAVSTFERFSSWADEHGVQICPPFSVETIDSDVWEGPRELLRTPVFCLEIAIEGRIAGVFPHADSSSEYTVTEAIAALKTGDLSLEETPVTGAAGSWDTDCPECGGRVVNVQGVGLCHDCGWNDWAETTQPVDVPTGGLINLAIEK